MSVKFFLETIPLSIISEMKNLQLTVMDQSVNKEMEKLLAKTVLVGGKRLRPIMTYLFGDFFSIQLSKITPLARAIELVHAASLSHDDVVDNATTRRGTPSINIVSSNQRAVLAGDYLLADVIVSLSRENDINLIREMSLVIQALSDGEWLQLNASESRKYSREIIEEIALKKTGSVISWCCVAPAYRYGASASVVEYCRELGHNIGIAFQMIDDTLDFSDKSQKDHFLDMENGIINSVIYEWLQMNPEINEAFKKGKKITDLWTNNKLQEAVEVVRERAAKKLARANELLEVVAQEAGLDSANIAKKMAPLKSMIRFIGERSL
ncbi:MAG: hypothetical protein A2504_08380 [Bdellovibrionales bacterium RIFOXYD12_FULL_39_22]|nr:MAG: hypothetical protein A2385_01605 [Bdellovibrionales bacterium RIFOXYB1_FULL_39_21]OFZ42859.1 MAG: hypothetical protein A2485_10765 [Bdellovibrionales bacterium RIFOXYC12_FULL_39_17]OFZ47481.1 MAG: hypothetical protein A2404_14525 [Bdellovibrionales bacterium RIFOXYC1_FULL_39_130]OFZ71098.1 MAG: hypothetical protein A2451_10900 [Bdellovibrionales bacterium RIFOXYC2_FULL_39_8]OFZ75569.1 MAG: hypothetical protein A2560_14675 [Bdellovibrionales bacterium RIFOXYD1_FULL_39_84]OFZ93892.1 MAG: